MYNICTHIYNIYVCMYVCMYIIITYIYATFSECGKPVLTVCTNACMH